MVHAYDYELAPLTHPPALGPTLVPKLAERSLGEVREILLASTEEAGTLGAALRYQFERGGTLLRARLACEAGQALGLDPEATQTIAAICELLQAASQIHEDIADGDAARGGRKPLWAEFGEDVAVNAGDYLIARAVALAASIAAEAEVRVAVAERVAECVTCLARGQDEERAFGGTLDATLEAYEATARNKCAPLLALPIGLALIVARAPAPQHRVAARAMADLGTAFQLQDDLLDLCGGKQREAGSDLRAGRATAPVLLYGARCDATRRRQLDEFLFFAPINPDAAEGWREAILLSDAVDATIARCALWQQSALASLDVLPVGLRRVIRQTTRALFGPVLGLQAARFDVSAAPAAGAA